MPTLEQYRDPVLRELGGILDGTVDLDPDPNDLDAARAIISAELFDGEKLSKAYGGWYSWIPRYGDCARIEDSGYRVRYVRIFDPPLTGSYVLTFYGYGSTVELPASTPQESLQAAIRNVDTDVLGDATVVENDDGSFAIYLPLRIGVGSTSGTLRGGGGLGVALAASDYRQPLTRGTRWYLSPYPFEAMDSHEGIHTAINQALNDIRIPDLYPIESLGVRSQRAPSLNIWGLVPWMQPEHIIGFFAPTDWEYTATFVPPAAGAYTVSLALGSTLYGPYATPLAYNASGAALEAALRAMSGVPTSASPQSVTVSPQGIASSYVITWRTQHHAPRFVPSAGYLASSQNVRLRDPHPMTLLPSYTRDYESPSLAEPGYPEGSSWFAHVLRPGAARICPQTYPLKADGTLNTAAEPIIGTEWIESSSGLVNDLDQAVPTVEQVQNGALRYTLAAIAKASPRGEKGEWEQAGSKQAGITAAGLIYGSRSRRGAGAPRMMPTLGPNSKGADFWY